MSRESDFDWGRSSKGKIVDQITHTTVYPIITNKALQFTTMK